MDGRRDQVTPRRAAGGLAAAFAGSLLALAAHLDLLRDFGTVLPYRDQWRLTAVGLLTPYLQGGLGLRDLFEPLNDHWPVLTRLLSFGLLQANGQWNNLLETTCNALLFASGVFIFLMRVLPGLPGRTRPVYAWFAGLLLALPVAWENTLWGIQSLVYLQIGLTLAYLAAVCTAQTFSRLWWSGHVAGVLVLFTQHSGILAHIAVGLVLAWRLWRGDGGRRVLLAGLGFAVAAVVAFKFCFPPLTTTAALRADSWELALEVALRQLAWPLPHPAWSLLLYAPWLLWTGSRLLTRRLSATDAFIVAAGLWVGAQAAAIGYGRAAETYTFASRYCDFLALGVLLNAACLLRLWTRTTARSHRGLLLLTGATWLLVPLPSLWWEANESHAGYNLSRRPAENYRNLQRLKNYFEHGDSAVLLNRNDVQQELYTYVPEILPLLENPRFQALLPPETGAPLARPDHGRLGWLTTVFLGASPWLTGGAFLLLGWSALRARGSPAEESPAISTTDISPSPLLIPSVLLGLGAVSALVALAWENSGVFDPNARLRDAFAPARDGVSLDDLQFQRADGSFRSRVNATGAVDTSPAQVRFFFYGTRLPVSPDFRGILQSNEITVSGRYLAVPFTGHPCFAGNGLRWRFVDPATQKESWESYVGRDAGESWDIWNLDASAYLGQKASLFLYDGNDGPAGWLGVARPAQSTEAGFAAHWRSRLRLERATDAHHTVAGTAVVASLLGAGWLTVSLGRSRRIKTPTP